jgi:hypothetical protein
MLAGFDADQDRQTDPDAVRIDDGDPARNDAGGFELLDAFPAGRRGKSDASAI